MGLGDVTGVLSRYFVLGYFVPAFFTLFALSRLLTPALLPDAFEQLSGKGEAAVVGAIALFAGLVLLGLRYPFIRAFEGYFLEFGPLRALRRPFVALQERSFDRLTAMRDDESRPRRERSYARRVLDRRFHRRRERLLPTRFGNAIRASENHAYTRHNLEAVALWPRVDPLLSEREQELHANALTDVALFVNSSLGALAAGAVLLVDAFWHSPLDGAEWLVYLVPPVLAYVCYRAAIGAAERLGTERRASMDLHRLELYDRLGVRSPTSFTDEHEHVAPAVNRWLLRGERPPDDLMKSVPSSRREEET